MVLGFNPVNITPPRCQQEYAVNLGFGGNKKKLEELKKGLIELGCPPTAVDSYINDACPESGIYIEKAIGKKEFIPRKILIEEILGKFKENPEKLARGIKTYYLL